MHNVYILSTSFNGMQNVFRVTKPQQISKQQLNYGKDVWIL